MGERFWEPDEHGGWSAEMCGLHLRVERDDSTIMWAIYGFGGQIVASDDADSAEAAKRAAATALLIEMRGAAAVLNAHLGEATP